MRKMSSHYCSVWIWILFGVTHVAADTAANHPKLSSCPDSPNCVSSQSDNSRHFIEPLGFAGNRDEARQKLLDVLNSQRRVRLVSSEANFIHAEFRSLIFGFVDDVEFYFPAEASIVHVRSASRTGYYDFGANRRRVERIRAAFKNPVE